MYLPKLDDIIEELEEAGYDNQAYFGDRLEQLVLRLRGARSEAKEQGEKVEAELKTAQDKLKELQGIEKFVEDVMGGKPVEVENKTTGAKRSVRIGEMVMFTDTMRNDQVALVLEIYGFPPGKVGLRTFGKGAAMDQFRIAEYSGDRNWNTWRFID